MDTVTPRAAWHKTAIRIKHIGVGALFTATCTCGWEGKRRITRVDAEDEGKRHVAGP